MKYFFKIILLILIVFVAIPLNAVTCTSPYQVTATRLNARSQPSTSGNVLVILHKGEKVCIGQERGNWGNIGSGWVNKKYLRLIEDSDQNSVQSVTTSSNDTSDDNGSGVVVGLGIIIVLAFIFFGLKTLFYHTLITLGMAEPDGRAKNGIRLTRLGKFMASISGLILLFLFMLIGSMSK